MTQLYGRIFCAWVVFGMGLSTPASAQVLGTFRWQFAPYCNVVTLRVEQKGALYELSGTEDGCNNAAPAATANGSAHLNANGQVGMSLAIVRPDGFVVNTAIELNPSTYAGTWKDNWANSGTFVFEPTLPVSAPPRLLTMVGDWSLVFPASGPTSEGTTSVSFPHALPSPPIAVAANIIPVGGPATANCPGSVTAPQAAPGHVCVYETFRANVAVLRTFSSAVTNNLYLASPTGVGIFAAATSSGNVYAYGRWAVSVP